MRRLAAFVAIICTTVLAVAAARAQTLDDLKAELAAKKADVTKLERRIRQMEGQTPAHGGVPVVAPVAAPTARPLAATPPPDDEELDRALERTLVRVALPINPAIQLRALGQNPRPVYQQCL